MDYCKEFNLSKSKIWSEWISSIKLQNIPKEVCDLSRMFLLDFLRLAISNCNLPWVSAPIAMCHSENGEATVLGVGKKTSVTLASFINASFGHASESDDAHVGATLHPGVVVWPAALAIAERENVCGADLLLAGIVGYEIDIRAGKAIMPACFQKGFHCTAVSGPFGAVSAVSSILSMDQEKIIHAIGIAASRAGGLAQFFQEGSTVKLLHAGFAAASGVFSALLAKEGATGPIGALDGKMGFLTAFGGTDSNILVKDLGKVYYQTDVLQKMHATSAHFHCAVEAAFELASDINIDYIKRIEVQTTRPVADKASVKDVKDIQGGQFSLAFSVALAFCKKGKWLMENNWLTIKDYKRGLSDSSVFSILERIECVGTTEIESLVSDQAIPAAIIVETLDGGERKKLVTKPKGSCKNPIPVKIQKKRFIEDTSPIIGCNKANSLLEKVMNIEDLSAISDLINLCFP